MYLILYALLIIVSIISEIIAIVTKNFEGTEFTYEMDLIYSIFCAAVLVIPFSEEIKSWIWFPGFIAILCICVIRVVLEYFGLYRTFVGTIDSVICVGILSYALIYAIEHYK